MKVRIKTGAAEGHVLDFPVHHARKLIAAGVAELPDVKPAAPEVAALEPAPEKATKPRPRRKSRSSRKASK